jgi:hypothetical protein
MRTATPTSMASADKIAQMKRLPMSGLGTFATCRRVLRMSEHQAGPQGGAGGPVARMSCRGPFNELAII